MEIKIYKNELPEASRRIRTEVFVEEQGFNEEFDSIDNSATHIVMYSGERPVATCRVYYSEEKSAFIIGRLAVVKPERSKGLGAVILNAAEDCIRENGGDSAVLSAQLRASKFYEKQGYTKFGELHFDESCPHISMKKKLK